MGKSTISMAIFNSYLKLPEGKLLDLQQFHFNSNSCSLLFIIHKISQVSDQDSAALRLIFLLVSSYIVQVLLLATDLLLDTQNPGICL